MIKVAHNMLESDQRRLVSIVRYACCPSVGLGIAYCFIVKTGSFLFFFFGGGVGGHHELF